MSVNLAGVDIAIIPVWFQYNFLFLWALRVLPSSAFNLIFSAYKSLFMFWKRSHNFNISPTKLSLRAQFLSYSPLTACTASIYLYILCEFSYR